MGKAIYYNFTSVREQVKNAQKKNIIEKYRFDLPQEVDGICIDYNWITQCTSLCTQGWCPIFLYIFIPSEPLPIRVNMYYVKENPTAYVEFSPLALDSLETEGIINTGLLTEEKNARRILPDIFK